MSIIDTICEILNQILSQVAQTFPRFAESDLFAEIDQAVFDFCNQET